MTGGASTAGAEAITGPAAFDQTDEIAVTEISSPLIKAHRGFRKLGLIGNRD